MKSDLPSRFASLGSSQIEVYRVLTGKMSYTRVMIGRTFIVITGDGFFDLYTHKTLLVQFVPVVLILSGFVVVGVFIATMGACFKSEDIEQI